MTALPLPPFVAIDGVHNFRDIGGYPISTPAGHVIRRGLVFRSSEPSKLTTTGEAALRDLRISHVYDLRSGPEIAMPSWGPREIEGAQRIFAPVWFDTDCSPVAMATRFDDFCTGHDGFAKVYNSILDASANPASPSRPLYTILKHLASPSPPTPLLVHCTAGKDRTGVICALILALCGVDDEVVAHEYNLTTIGLADRMPDMIQYVKNQVPPEKQERSLAVLGVSTQALLAILKKIRDEHGSVEQYLIDKHGLQQSDIEQLRKNMIVPVGEGNQPIDWESHAKLLV